MAGTSKISPVSERDIHYYRQRAKNRIFESLTSFFAEEAERTGVTKRDIAECLHRDPAQITRWLSSPSNLTIDTISDLLLSLGAEMDHTVAKFSERAQSNEMHPLIAKLTVAAPPATKPKVEYKQPAPNKAYQPLANMQSNTQTVEAKAA
jgi:transcriptional regulator with XRE-family HTH domain